MNIRVLSRRAMVLAAVLTLSSGAAQASPGSPARFDLATATIADVQAGFADGSLPKNTPPLAGDLIATDVPRLTSIK